MAKSKKQKPRPPPPLNRKQQRKLKRQQKKQKHQRSDPVAAEVIPKPVTNKKKKQNIQPSKESQIKLDRNSEEMKFKKLQRSMHSSRIKRLKEDNIREDKLIKRLEKRLSLNHNKNGHLSKSFVNEGLDYLLEVCDFDKYKGKLNLETEFNDIQMKSEFVDDLSTTSQTESGKKTAKKSKNDILDDTLESEETFTIEKNKKNRKRKKKKQEQNSKTTEIKKPKHEEEIEEECFSMDEYDDDMFEDEVGVENEENSGLQEDIYGRLRTKDGSVVENKTKYVPPQLRNKNNQSQTNSEKLLKLKKQLKGLLNRLTGKNMHSIITQIEQIYGNNSRHDVNSTLTELLKETIISFTFSPMRIIIEHALLISILHANVGIEVGSYVLQKFVEEYQTLLNESNLPVEDKRIDNVIAAIVQLYNFKVFHANLVYEILDRLLERFQDKDIDLMLLIFKNVGFNLRKDDPAKLKEIIFNIQKKANSSSGHSENLRTKFMLETLLAIKNNNKLKVIQTEADYIESLKKLSKTLLHAGKYLSELNITVEDLLNAESKGRWWIVGSAWQGNAPNNEKPNTKSASLAFDEKLLDLARKQRMNTDIRKNIFCILMSAEDFMDAFEKLLKLGLKGNQCQEVIYVTMHCLLQEKEYNPYYSFIAEQFSTLHRKYQLAIQFCSWDKFKEIESLGNQQISNLSQFLAYLIQNKKLSLSVLKVLQFTEMNRPMVRFLRQLLLAILMTNTETTIADVFHSISKSDGLFMLREGLQLFLHHFILKEAANKSSEGNEQMESLPKKVEIAENAMRGADTHYERKLTKVPEDRRVENVLQNERFY